MTRRQFLALLTPLLVVILGFTVVVALERRDAAPWDAEFAEYVRDRMAREFVGGSGDESQQWLAEFNALNAYVKTFDSYAEIVPPGRVEASKEADSGRYTGIGVRIGPIAAVEGPVESVLVTGVKPGGPAATAGVTVGDRIVAVGEEAVSAILPDGRAAAALGRESPLQKAIRGPDGSHVVLRLRAPDGVTREARVTRGQVDEGSVFGSRLLPGGKGIGYARVAGFKASTAKDLRAELEKLADAGMKALVLDLRENNGGFMDQAIAVANLFLAEGTIVRQRGRIEQFNGTYKADPKNTWNAKIPVAVLVNGLLDRRVGSASASEILAGALRDHRRAVLVGERTYGKFLVQLVEEVETKAGPAIFRRTTSIYETPLGRHYQRAPGDADDPLAGIPPDLVVTITAAERERLADVFEDEVYAGWNPGRAPTVVGFVDRQLDAARMLLSGEPCYPVISPP